MNDDQTPAPLKVRIKIQRVGVFYYYSRWINDEAIEGAIPMTRQSVYTIITSLENGAIPEGINLDACHPRHWVWEKEIMS